MSAEGLIRVANKGDAAAVLEIYRPYVLETFISFEMEPPTLEEMQARIAKVLQQWPWLVYELAGQVAGYAYASRHRERAAYQWAVDVAVYVRPGVQRGGIGRALYTRLFEILRQQGYYNAYAGIALPNAASVGLHEAVGFRPVGIYHRVGYKLEEWRDVGWWELNLQTLPTQPVPPTPFSALSDGI